MAKKRNRVTSSVAPMRTVMPPSTRSAEYWPLLGGVSGRNGDLVRSESGSALAYEAVTIVYRCANLIAQAVNALPWDIVTGEGDDETIIASSEDRRARHPFARALADVYADQRVPFLSLLVYSRLLWGESYIELTRNAYGYPRGLRWLNPLATMPRIISGQIYEYQYYEMHGGRAVTLPVGAVAYDKTFNPSDDLRGYSTVDASMDAINLHRNVKRAVKAFFKNNARPGMVVSPNGDIPFSPRDIEIIKQQLTDFHMGVNQQNTALVSPMKALFESLELPDIQKQYSINIDLMREICIGFGVPLAMAGDSSSSAFKDGREVKQAFFDTTIKPLALTLQDFLNTSVLPFFDDVSLYGDGTTFRFDLSALEEDLAGDKSRADLVDQQVKGGYISIADGARAMGLKPDTAIEDRYVIGDLIVPKSEIANLWRYKLGLGAPSPDTPPPADPSPVSVSTPLAPQLPATVAPVQAIDDTPQRDTTSLCVLMSLANNVDLLALQRDLQTKFSDQSITWNTPDSFHITLLYAPAADEAALSHLVSYIEAYPPPALSLNIGSLATFDNLNEHALHFRIRSNTALREYQADLYAACEAAGLPMSQYSRPADWKPHVTMGYAEQRIPVIPFHSTLRVSPSEVQVSVEREGGYEVIGRMTCGGDGVPQKAYTPHDHSLHDLSHHHAPVALPADPSSLFPVPLSYEDWKRAALDELKAWQKHIKTGKPRPFAPVHTRGTLADRLTGALKACDDMTAAFDQAFAAVRTSAFDATLARISAVFAGDVRAWSDTKQEFEDEILLAIDDARNGSLKKAGFITLMNDLIETLGEQAYIDGLSDSGVDDALDDDDRATIDRLIGEQRGYVSSLADTLYDTGITDAQADAKVSMWLNKSLVPFYQSAIAAADANALMEWVEGDTKEKCDSCLRLSGQRHRMKDWVKSGWLPQSSKLSCSGFNCLCRLVLVRGRSRGDF